MVLVTGLLACKIASGLRDSFWGLTQDILGTATGLVLLQGSQGLHQGCCYAVMHGAGRGFALLWEEAEMKAVDIDALLPAVYAVRAVHLCSSDPASNACVCDR